MLGDLLAVLVFGGCATGGPAGDGSGAAAAVKIAFQSRGEGEIEPCG
ncbi:MAG: hypothetical protein ABMB14_35580 [Myxococcota bacterium]